MLTLLFCLLQPPTAPLITITFGEPSQKVEFTAAALAKLPRYTLKLNGSDGNPATYSGYLLSDVLKADKVPMGLELRGRGVAPLALIAEASDGGRAVFAFAEVEPSFSDKVILLTDQREGKALSSDEGPLRIIVSSDKRHACWLRGVARLTVKKLERCNSNFEVCRLPFGIDRNLFSPYCATVSGQGLSPSAREGSPSMSTLKFPTPTQPVPLFDAKMQYKGLKVHLEEACRRVLDSGCAIGGKEVEGLEQEFASYCGAACAVGCASGTDAISLALKALDIGPGDEVITTPFTFFATASCVARLGATPVFVDIDPYTFNINPSLIEAKITSRTKAIMPVHLYGQCADMEPIWQIAEKHNIPVIEDAAQSTGSEYQGKRCGTLGAMACFSFYPTKNLGTYGDGGMIVTNDREWAKKLVCLRNHGMYTRYYHEEMGWNSRLDAIQAAMLRVKLPYVDLWNSARQAIAGRYDHLLEEQHLTGFLTLPTVRSYGKHCFNQYIVRVADGQRDVLRKHLADESVGSEIYYPLPLHQQKVFAYLGYQTGDFPVTEKACKEVLALPMFPELTLEQQRRVVQSCLSFLVKQRGMRQAA